MAITNLTNTKWIINSTTCTAGYGQFNINYNVYDNGGIIVQDEQLFVGYSWAAHQETFVPTTNTIMSPMGILIIQTGMTIEITGGTDVTNSNLISWLTANATQLPMTTSIIIGENTLTGIDTIKVQDSVDTTQYKDFIYGATPSSTTSIKLGNNTLNGVNQISVMGTDDTYKSFGYVAPVSGYNVTLDGTGQYQDIGDDFYGHMKINTPPSSFDDQDAIWGAGSGNTFIYDGTGQNPTLTKTFTNVKKLYCWGDDDGSENALVKINNVNISVYDWNNPYVIDITEDCTLTVMASTEG